jgi:hypothetical protein
MQKKFGMKAKKATIGVENLRVREREKYRIIFRRGGGVNIVFRPKYRPLKKYDARQQLFQSRSLYFVPDI